MMIPNDSSALVAAGITTTCNSTKDASAKEVNAPPQPFRNVIIRSDEGDDIQSIAANIRKRFPHETSQILDFNHSDDRLGDLFDDGEVEYLGIHFMRRVLDNIAQENMRSAGHEAPENNITTFHTRSQVSDVAMPTSTNMKSNVPVPSLDSQDDSFPVHARKQSNSTQYYATAWIPVDEKTGLPSAIYQSPLQFTGEPCSPLHNSMVTQTNHHNSDGELTQGFQTPYENQYHLNMKQWGTPQNVVSDWQSNPGNLSMMHGPAPWNQQGPQQHTGFGGIADSGMFAPDIVGCTFVSSTDSTEARSKESLQQIPYWDKICYRRPRGKSLAGRSTSSPKKPRQEAFRPVLRRRMSEPTRVNGLLIENSKDDIKGTGSKDIIQDFNLGFYRQEKNLNPPKSQTDDVRRLWSDSSRRSPCAPAKFEQRHGKHCSTQFQTTSYEGTSYGTVSHNFYVGQPIENNNLAPSQESFYKVPMQRLPKLRKESRQSMPRNGETNERHIQQSNRTIDPYTLYIMGVDLNEATLAYILSDCWSIVNVNGPYLANGSACRAWVTFETKDSTLREHVHIMEKLKPQPWDITVKTAFVRVPITEQMSALTRRASSSNTNPVSRRPSSQTTAEVAIFTSGSITHRPQRLEPNYSTHACALENGSRINQKRWQQHPARIETEDTQKPYSSNTKPMQEMPPLALQDSIAYEPNTQKYGIEEREDPKATTSSEHASSNQERKITSTKHESRKRKNSKNGPGPLQRRDAKPTVPDKTENPAAYKSESVLANQKSHGDTLQDTIHLNELLKSDESAGQLSLLEKGLKRQLRADEGAKHNSGLKDSGVSSTRVTSSHGLEALGTKKTELMIKALEAESHVELQGRTQSRIPSMKDLYKSNTLQPIVPDVSLLKTLDQSEGITKTESSHDKVQTKDCDEDQRKNTATVTEIKTESLTKDSLDLSNMSSTSSERNTEHPNGKQDGLIVAKLRKKKQQQPSLNEEPLFPAAYLRRSSRKTSKNGGKATARRMKNVGQLGQEVSVAHPISDSSSSKDEQAPCSPLEAQTFDMGGNASNDFSHTVGHGPQLHRPSIVHFIRGRAQQRSIPGNAEAHRRSRSSSRASSHHSHQKDEIASADIESSSSRSAVYATATNSPNSGSPHPKSPPYFTPRDVSFPKAAKLSPEGSDLKNEVHNDKSGSLRAREYLGEVQEENEGNVKNAGHSTSHQESVQGRDSDLEAWQLSKTEDSVPLLKEDFILLTPWESNKTGLSAGILSVSDSTTLTESSHDGDDRLYTLQASDVQSRGDFYVQGPVVSKEVMHSAETEESGGMQRTTSYDPLLLAHVESPSPEASNEQDSETAIVVKLPAQTSSAEQYSQARAGEKSDSNDDVSYYDGAKIAGIVESANATQSETGSADLPSDEAPETMAQKQKQRQKQRQKQKRKRQREKKLAKAKTETVDTDQDCYSDGSSVETIVDSRSISKKLTDMNDDKDKRVVLVSAEKCRMIQRFCEILDESGHSAANSNPRRSLVLPARSGSLELTLARLSGEQAITAHEARLSSLLGLEGQSAGSMASRITRDLLNGYEPVDVVETDDPINPGHQLSCEVFAGTPEILRYLERLR